MPLLTFFIIIIIKLFFFKLFFFKHVFTRTVTFECVEKYANESILQLKKKKNFLEHIPADMELEASYTLDRPLVHQAHRERQVRTLTSTLTGYLTPINLSKETEGNSRRHRKNMQIPQRVMVKGKKGKTKELQKKVTLKLKNFKDTVCELSPLNVSRLQFAVD